MLSGFKKGMGAVENRLEQACTTQKARRDKLININSPRAAKVYFVVVWKKF